MIHQDTIEAVRKAARIADLFPGSDLKKAGREMITLCPFHNDSKPSLRISPQKGTYFCDVCVEGGDSLKLLQLRDGLTFSEAVLNLAERYRVQVQYADDDSAEKAQAQLEERRKLLAAGERMAAQWHQQLGEDAPMELWDYLEERGIADAVDDWELGWGASSVWLNQERFVIPLRDVQGRPVGFVARRLSWSKGDKDGKWINSRNSPLFNKSSHVFALDRVVRTARQFGEVVVVEGQLDAIACHVHGLTNTVAVGGLGLTADHVREITRTTGISKLVLALDGDAAGQRAQDKLLGNLLPKLVKGELDLRILSLPGGQDPAEVGAGMADLVAAAPLWFIWWWDREVGRVDLTDPAAVQQAHKGVRRMLEALPEGAARDYIQKRSATDLQFKPRVQAKAMVTFATTEDCWWFSRRALRACLNDADCSQMVGQLELLDPRHQQIQAMQVLMQAMDPSMRRQRRNLLLLANSQDQDLREELLALANPLPEVKRHLKGRWLDELTHCLDRLNGGCSAA